MAGTILHTLAKKKMLQARAGVAPLPKIVGMAFGNGGVNAGGAVVQHSPDQNALHSELLRKQIDGYTVVSDTLVRYACTLAAEELAGEYISELALYDADGDIVCSKSFMKKGKDGDIPTTYEVDDIF